MRTAVKKPHTPKIHSSTHSVHASRHQHDPKTKVRAAQSVNVHKSSMISKFGGTSKSRPVLATSVLPVKEEPARIPHLKDLPAKRGGHASDNPFREAIENSSAHELPRHRKPRLHHRVTRKLHVKPRAAGLASLATAFLLIGGFFAYQNVPNLAVKMAATRAGVKAQLPAYRPAGFAMSGPVQYRPGHIAISFKSKTDDRNFVVSQSNSEWNSETLLENFVTSSRRPYQTYQDKGKTIYIYDGSNATWVDSGVWYKIEGNSSLNSDQLIRIANSL
jgi:hypothetical protein